MQPKGEKNKTNHQVLEEKKKKNLSQETQILVQLRRWEEASQWASTLGALPEGLGLLTILFSLWQTRKLVKEHSHFVGTSPHPAGDVPKTPYLLTVICNSSPVFLTCSISKARGSIYMLFLFFNTTSFPPWRRARIRHFYFNS